MTSKISKKTAALAMMGALAVPVGYAIAPASAESPAPSTTTQLDIDQSADDAAATTSSDTISPAAPAAGPEARAARRSARRTERQKLVADKLGVTPEQLRQARLDVLKDQLDARVASGRITQARADEILDAAKSGNLQQLRNEIRAARAAGR